MKPAIKPTIILLESTEAQKTWKVELATGKSYEARTYPKSTLIFVCGWETRRRISEFSGKKIISAIAELLKEAERQNPRSLK